MTNDIAKTIRTHAVKIDQIDVAIDSAAQRLDLLRMAYKTKGLEGCAEEFERYENAHDTLDRVINKAFKEA